jgi:hypothetical protein
MLLLELEPQKSDDNVPYGTYKWNCQSPVRSGAAALLEGRKPKGWEGVLSLHGYRLTGWQYHFEKGTVDWGEFLQEFFGDDGKTQSQLDDYSRDYSYGRDDNDQDYQPPSCGGSTHTSLDTRMVVGRGGSDSHDVAHGVPVWIKHMTFSEDHADMSSKKKTKKTGRSGGNSGSVGSRQCGHGVHRFILGRHMHSAMDRLHFGGELPSDAKQQKEWRQKDWPFTGGAAGPHI